MTHPIIEIINLDIEKELACKCCGLYNYDPEFLIRWQAFRYTYGAKLSVTSGGRCKKHNLAVGGVEGSCHVCEGKSATATDVTADNLQRLFSAAKRSELFNEVIWYIKKNIVHLGLDRNQSGNYFKII